MSESLGSATTIQKNNQNASDASAQAMAMKAAVRQWTMAVVRRLFLRQFLIFCTAYLFVWGTVVLVMRVAVNQDRLPLLWGSAGLLVLLILAGVVAYRQRPEAAAVRAMLDSHSQGGGLYMSEAASAGWADRMPALRMPKVQWRGGRQGLLVIAAAAFLVAAFVVPRWVTQVGQNKPLNVSSQVAELNRQLETLEEESVLMPEQATELSEKLKQVTADADGSDPVKTWESLDHIKSQMQDVAAQAVEKAAQQAQTLDQAQMLAQALAQQPDALSPEQMARAMQSLRDMAAAAAAENEKLRELMKEKGLDPAAMKQGQQGQEGQQGVELTKEQLEALAQALSLSKEELEALMKKLAEAGLAQNPSQGQSAGNGSKPGQTMTSEQVAEALAEMMEGKSVEEIMEMISKAKFGQGGVGRGGGPTDMTWNDNPSSSENTKFEDQVLPPAKLRALKDSQRVGLSAAAPKTAEVPGDSTGGVLPTDKANGSAVDQQILPRHRQAVREFFEREKK